MSWIKRLFSRSPRPESFQVLQALEEERMRIARDIHDGPLQDFAAMVMDLDLQVHKAQRSRQLEVQELGQQLAELHQSSLAILKSMRECLYIMRSPEIESLGLHATLRQGINTIQHQTGLDIRLEIGDGYREIPSVQALTLYRIMHEALMNVYKHAQAKHAWVRLEFGESEVRMSVVDDGCGFDVRAGLQKEKHMGLGTMQERAALAGGHCTLESEPGKGTTVTVTLPIPGGKTAKSLQPWKSQRPREGLADVT